MKDFKIYLSIACVLMLVYLIAQYNKPTPVNWSQTFYYNDKIPFGTYIVYNQLPRLFPGAHVVKTNGSLYRTFHDFISMGGNYLVIAQSVKINKDDFNAMVKYIEAGNAVFISSLAFNGFLADTLKLATDYEYKGGNTKLNFTNNGLKQPEDYAFSNGVSNRYFSGFDTAKATVISKNNFGNSNLLSFKFGKGSLYVCATPGVFTNYNLLNRKGADYAAKAMSYLPITRNVYWDEYQNGDIAGDESPMRVFFSNPSLQWAYYLSLVGIIIFVLFEMKRRQRVIPVIEPLSNSTLDFVNVVGQVYYEKRDNANIAHKKILYLLEHIRDEYNIRTNKLDTEFIERLQTKLGLDAKFANELVNFIQRIAGQNYISDNDLINLNKLIEQFYSQSA